MIEIPKTPVLMKDLGMMYPTETSKKKRRYGLYKCSCGNEFRAMVQGVKSGHTNSCGCYHTQIVTKHGLSDSLIYSIWNAMIQRTTNSKQKAYKNYGGRGIKVCDRWKNVANFINDMSPTYRDGLTIDRVDTNGNYEPGNCRWANMNTQNQNTRLIQKNNTSGYRGVSYNKLLKNWRVRIDANGRHINLGLHQKKKQAARAYDTYVVTHNLEHTINEILQCKI